MELRVRARIWLVVASAVALFAVPFGVVRAEHWMGSYHWPQGPVVQVDIGDNVSAGWEDELDGAVMAWSDPVVVAPDVVDLTVVSGGTSPKSCKPTAGRVEVCATSYGQTGWLGLAQIWAANHDNHVHITQAIVKANDTYFNTPYYDTPDWRNTVMCHEIGHTLGLGHRDEDFGTSVGSCMDYADPPTPLPDEHDYEELNYVYTVFFDPNNHPTTSSTGGGGGGGGRGRGNLQVNPGDASGWGRLVSERWNESIFEADLGFGQRLRTIVIWAN